jgi:hypothetical protein
MQNVIKIRFCQNLSKFQDRTEESRRENGASGEDSQPLRHFCLRKLQAKMAENRKSRFEI